MSKFVKGSLLSVIALSFGGCIFVSDDTNDIICGDGFTEGGETCDDGNLTPGDGCSATCSSEGAIFASPNTWGFVDLGFDGAGQLTSTPLACPGGQFDTAAVISQATDPNTGLPIGNCGPSTPAGTCFVDLFNCVDMAGTVNLPGGTYLRWIAITTNNGGTTHASTPSAYITVDAATDSFGGTIIDNGGFFLANWQLQDTATSAPLTCAAAGVNGVAIDSTVVSSSNAVADTFDCDVLEGLTGGIPGGAYTVSVQALNAQQQALGPATVLTNQSIGVRNAITDLGTVSINVD